MDLLFLFSNKQQEHDKKWQTRKKRLQNLSENNSFDSDPDAIPRMSRMLYIDRSITDINIKDSTYSYGTALHFQSQHGTTGSVAWLLRQDPPPGIDVRNSYQYTPLMAAAWSDEDSEGKVRLLLDHGADRDMISSIGYTALNLARLFKKPAAVIDMLENYRPDVSR